MIYCLSFYLCVCVADNRNDVDSYDDATNNNFGETSREIANSSTNSGKDRVRYEALPVAIQSPSQTIPIYTQAQLQRAHSRYAS